MTKFIKRIDSEVLDEDEELFEMSNVRKIDTRLPVNIWLDDHGVSRNNTHNLPRIKFQANKADKVNGKGIPISIDKVKPEILIDNYKDFTELNNYEIGQVKNFIIRNYDLSMKYWNQEIYITDFLKQVKKV